VTQSLLMVRTKSRSFRSLETLPRPFITGGERDGREYCTKSSRIAAP
jgi:hypothetical protein